MTDGLNPHNLKFRCSNCGESVRPTRQVGAYASVPVECRGCESTGTIIKNRLGMVEGTYGAVTYEELDA